MLQISLRGIVDSLDVVYLINWIVKGLSLQKFIICLFDISR